MNIDVPTLPRIEASVSPDGTGRVVIQGRAYPVDAADDEAARAEILALVTAAASKLERTVLLNVRDSRGSQMISVYPDGGVETLSELTAPGPLPSTRLGVHARRDAAPSWAPLSAPDDGASDTRGNDLRDDLYDQLEATHPSTDLPPNVHEFRRSPFAPPAPSSAAPSSVPPEYSVRSTTIALTPSGPILARGNILMSALEPLPTLDPDAAIDADPEVAVQPEPEVHVASEPEVEPAPEVDPTPESKPTREPEAEPTAEPAPAPEPEPEPTPVQSAIPVPAATMTTTTDTPTLTDFLQSRPPAPAGPATAGWQGVLHRITGGLISPTPNATELGRRRAIGSVQRGLSGPRTVVVINPKGGAQKTTATLLLGATFGLTRGGSTLAWDNNETRGTLGWRAQPARHVNTAVDLLRDLDRFSEGSNARLGDLDNYVRAQGTTQFDVLASDEDAAASSTIDAEAFARLHETLSRFYRVIVIDTGNNMRASNWEAAVEVADQLVIVSTVREDTAASAAWLVDGLRKKGHEAKVRRAVTVLAAPAKVPDAQLSRRLRGHFASLTRAVLDVPYDPALVDGGTLNYDALAPLTREAWLRVTATVADGL